MPILNIHGDADVVVPLKDNSGEMARRYREIGGKVALIVPEGAGAQYVAGLFQCQQLMDLVIAAASSEDVKK